MRPRLGQYIIFDASKASGLSADGLLLTRPIQPLPTDTTKGIFIYSTLYGHIVVGPTSDETTIRENATPDPAVREKLMAHAYTVCGNHGWVIDWRLMGNSFLSTCPDLRYCRVCVKRE